MLDTIVALATPPLRSALGVIRMSGDKSFEIISRVFSKEIIVERNKIYHGFIKDNDEIIDEVVLLAYKNPYSYTGEDSIEIMCHGSPIIFNEILGLLVKNGARLATGGEFTSRAYLNNKIDLIQAESINDLINAESKESKNISMMSLRGNTSKLIEPLKEDFAYLLSLIEVNIDYPEYEDLEEVNNAKVIEVLSKNKEYIIDLIKDGKKGKIIKDGINVALVGKPNVGKSSLLNRLINEEKAIVSSIEGTTRDVVEGKFILNGVLINLFDTAGIRESTDIIEEIGIKKSKKTLEDADLVIFIIDSELQDEDKEVYKLIKDKKHIIVRNKTDLINDEIKDENIVYTSALNNDINSLKEAILKELNLSKENYTNPSISNTRELGILESTLDLIDATLNDAKNGVTLDLLSENIRKMYLNILSLTGEDYDFDIASEIFSRFCVGK